MKQQPLFNDSQFKFEGNPKLSVGKGPDGKHCRDCANLRKKDYHCKAYYKCVLIGNSNGPGTDIRLKWPACYYFKQDEKPKE